GGAQGRQHRRVHGGHVAHATQLRLGHGGAEQPGVAAGEAHGRADLLGQALAEHGEDVLDHQHRGLGSHAQPAHEAVLQAALVERRGDVRPAAVHHHGRSPPLGQAPDAGGHGRAGRWVGHGVAAVLDDQAHGRERTTTVIGWPRPPGAARYVMDITFGTDGWRDVIAAGFTFANVRRAAAAYADHLLARGGGLVLLGYDTRFLGREFAEQAAAVLAERGLEARVSVDYLPTPALSFAVKRYGAAGGVMITASHNPPRYGGFKLKGPYGGTATQAIYADVAARVPAGPVPEGRGAFGAFDVREEYYDALAALVDVEALRAAAPRVVHDAIGGAGAGWLAGFAARTGALEVIEVRGRPDPLFHGVNPEPIPANVVSTAELMAEADD